MSFDIGDEVPEFGLHDTDRKTRHLSEFRGRKTVLAFFPGAFTSVCTKELCTFRDSMANFERLKAQVIGISVNDPFTLKAFADVNALSFPLLSDYRREVILLYKIAHDNFAGLEGYTAAKRSVFVLDEQGKLIHKWISDDPGKEPNYGEIMSVLGQAG